MNPVLSREILERFRTRRAPWFIFAWTLGIGLVGYVVYLVAQQVSKNMFGMGRLVATGFMGRFLFQAMALLMMTAVVMVVPGVTALAIVGERERQTLGLLQITQLSPLQLIFGKLTSSLSYLLVLIVAVAPIIALPLLFGGMSVGDILAAVAMMILTAIMIGSVSIAISARARSSRGAVAGSYAFSFVLAIFTFAMLLAELLLVQGANGSIVPARGREVYSSWLNPYVAMVDAIDTPLVLRTDGQFTPFVPIEALLYARQGVSAGVTGGFGGPVMEGDFRVVGPQGQQEVRMRRGPVWVRNLIIYAVVSALALLRAARVVRAPAARPLRIKRYRNVPT